MSSPTLASCYPLSIWVIAGSSKQCENRYSYHPIPIFAQPGQGHESVNSTRELANFSIEVWKNKSLLFFAGLKVVCRRTRYKVLLTWRVDCQSLEWLLMYGHKGSNCSGSQHLKSQGERGERWTEAEQSDDSQYPGEAAHSEHGWPVIPTGVQLPSLLRRSWLLLMFPMTDIPVLTSHAWLRLGQSWPLDSPHHSLDTQCS